MAETKKRIMHKVNTALLFHDERIKSTFEEMMNCPESLKWFPWIGKEYFNSEHRVLIVGESHYLLDEDDENAELIKQEADCPDFTQNVLQTKCIDDKKNTQPTFDNLARCLFGKPKTEGVPKELAFYNFVQRPMESNKERPTSEDMEKGWKVFAELIKILKPTHCIFIGFAAADSGHRKPYICKFPCRKEKVGKYYARLFSAKIDEQNTCQCCQCIAIKHTSQYFSWRLWSKFLQDRYPKMMEYLKYQIPQL